MKINLPLVVVLFVGLLFTSFDLLAQDIIYKKDQTKIECKVIKITDNLVEYRKIQQADGPIRTIYQTDIHQIVYADGTFEIFNRTAEVQDKKIEKQAEPQPQAEPVSIAPITMYQPPVAANSNFSEGSLAEKLKKKNLTKLAVAASFGAFDDENVSKIYDGLGGMDLKFVIGLSQTIRLGGFYNKLSADGTPITYGDINQDDTDSKLEMKAYGLEIDLYLGKSFYFLGRYGALKLSEELNAFDEQVSGDLDGAVTSLGAGVDIHLSPGFGLYLEGMYNWRSLKDFEIDGALNGGSFSGGLFVKF